MKLIIDRFEGNYAVCESQSSKKFVRIKRAKIPDDAKEGHVLSRLQAGAWVIDEAETASRALSIKTKMDTLWN